MNQPATQLRPSVPPVVGWLGAFWPVLAWAVLIFVLSSIPGHRMPAMRISVGDKLVHVLVYGVMGALGFRAFVRGTSWGGGRALLAAAALALVYGISDEVHQLFVTKRSAELLDVVADGIGGSIGAAAACWLSQWNRGKQRHSQRRH